MPISSAKNSFHYFNPSVAHECPQGIITEQYDNWYTALDGLLHLVPHREVWHICTTYAHPCCTKCTSPPIRATASTVNITLCGAITTFTALKESSAKNVYECLSVIYV